MVKLFVGNLSEKINRDRLIEMFAPHCKVSECDVLKNYAFVHIPDDVNVDELIKRLEGHILDGRAIHVERSTSRLRKQPGMSDKCFRCGSTEHKTTNCPHNEKTDSNTSMIKIDLTNSAKRPYMGNLDGPPSKQSTHGYFVGGQPTAATVQLQPQQAPHPGVIDPEIPRPVHGDLQALYDQYLESRTRYQYFRDRLLKENQTRSMGGVMTSQMTTNIMSNQSTLTNQLAAQPVTYLTQPNIIQQQQPVSTASHPYANAAALKAPYAVGQMVTTSMGQPNQVVQQPQSLMQQPQHYNVPSSGIVQQNAPYAIQQQQPPMYQSNVQQPQPLTQYAMPSYTQPSNGVSATVSGTPGSYRWN